MALHKLERRNYDGKLPVSIKYQNLHSLKEGLNLLCQSILETRKITLLHGSAHFTIPLNLEGSLNFDFHIDTLIKKARNKCHALVTVSNCMDSTEDAFLRILL